VNRIVSVEVSDTTVAENGAKSLLQNKKLKIDR